MGGGGLNWIAYVPEQNAYVILELFVVLIRTSVLEFNSITEAVAAEYETKNTETNETL